MCERILAMKHDGRADEGLLGKFSLLKSGPVRRTLDSIVKFKTRQPFCIQEETRLRAKTNI